MITVFNIFYSIHNFKVGNIKSHKIELCEFDRYIQFRMLTLLLYHTEARKYPVVQAKPDSEYTLRQFNIRSFGPFMV